MHVYACMWMYVYVCVFWHLHSKKDCTPQVLHAQRLALDSKSTFSFQQNAFDVSRSRTSADRSICDCMYHWANVVIHTCWKWSVYIQLFAHSGDTYTYYRIHTDTCNTYTYLQIHTQTYTRQLVPGGSFQALQQPIENPLECTGYRDHLRLGLRQDCRQDCRAQKAYEMPMGGAKGALWTPPTEGICTFGVNMHK